MSDQVGESLMRSSKIRTYVSCTRPNLSDFTQSDPNLKLSIRASLIIMRISNTISVPCFLYLLLMCFSIYHRLRYFKKVLKTNDHVLA